jgi:hypothetical protein
MTPATDQSNQTSHNKQPSGTHNNPDINNATREICSVWANQTGHKPQSEQYLQFENSVREILQQNNYGSGQSSGQPEQMRRAG